MFIAILTKVLTNEFIGKGFLFMALIKKSSQSNAYNDIKLILYISNKQYSCKNILPVLYTVHTDQ